MSAESLSPVYRRGAITFSTAFTPRQRRIAVTAMANGLRRGRDDARGSARQVCDWLKLVEREMDRA